MAAEPMVSTQIVLPVVDRLRAVGVRAQPILARLGIDRDTLEDVDELVALDKYVQFFEDAAHACGDTHFGLNAGRLLDSGGLGALGFLFLSAPTLYDAFFSLKEYLHALQEATEVNFVVDGDHARFTYQITADSIAPRRHDTEYSLAAMYKLGASYLRRPFTLSEIQFEHGRVGAHSFYESHFGCEVFFSQPTNTLTFPADLLSISAPFISRKLYPIIQSHLRDVISTRDASTSFSNQIATLLDSPSLAGRPSIAKVARKLGISESTLARRLRAEGTSFHEVLSEKRMNVAKRLLRHSDMPIGDIALALGYAENASFTRAFKLKCDMTPEKFRATHHH